MPNACHKSTHGAFICVPVYIHRRIVCTALLRIDEQFIVVCACMFYFQAMRRKITRCLATVKSGCPSCGTRRLKKCHHTTNSVKVQGSFIFTEEKDSGINDMDVVGGDKEIERTSHFKF